MSGQELLAALCRATGQAFAPVAQTGRWMANPVVRADDAVAYLATDERGRARVRAEAGRLAWAAAAGVPVPAVRTLDDDARWLVVERVPDDELYGPAFVDAALEAAAALAAAGQVPPGAPRDRNGRRTDRPLRIARGLRERLPLREFQGLRAEVDALPDDVTGHGDFHEGNVLSAGGTRVHVIDFEFLGPAACGADLAELWAALPDRADRDRLLVAARAALPGHDAQLRLLVHFVAVRHLLDVVTTQPRHDVDRAQVDRARALVVEARAVRG